MPSSYHFGSMPRLCTAALLALALTGCLSVKPSPKASFFQLQPLIEPAEALPGFQDDALTVSIGPIELSRYLTRPQIAWRQGDYEIAYDEFQRWAEPLERNVAHVLEANLSNLLYTDIIAIFPWEPLLQADLRIAVHVDRMEGTPGAEATLTLRWLISRGRPVKEFAIATEQTFTTKVEGDTTADVVEAQSKLLAEASRRIAADISRALKTKTQEN